MANTGKINSIICMIGAFPPPIHGMSTVNEKLKINLNSPGVKIITINLSPHSPNRAFLYRLIRFFIVIYGILVFIFRFLMERFNTVYISISGGFGQLYDIIFIGLARIFKTRIYLHHHSYSYLYKRNIINRILIYFAGKKTTHIALCKDMEQRLKTNYSIDNIIVNSNSVFITKPSIKSINIKETLNTLGFLSNISLEKGILDFIDLADNLVKNKLELKYLIGGPFENASIEKIVTKHIKSLKQINYRGPVYGKLKDAFLNDIDVLVFPSTYNNEAEPLTVYEALSFGIPVITFNRGCLENIVTSETGLLIDRTENFVNEAMKQIMIWYSSPLLFQRYAKNARISFTKKRGESIRSYRNLLTSIRLNK